MIILALSSSVMANAVQLELIPTRYGPGLTEIGTGKVILNNPNGAINFIVQVNIENAQENTWYDVWIIADPPNLFLPLDHGNTTSPWFYLGEFLTDEDGNGHFHSNIKLEDLGVRENIKVALNPITSTNPHGGLASYKSEKGEIEIK